MRRQGSRSSLGCPSAPPFQKGLPSPCLKSELVAALGICSSAPCSGRDPAHVGTSVRWIWATAGRLRAASQLGLPPRPAPASSVFIRARISSGWQWQPQGQGTTLSRTTSWSPSLGWTRRDLCPHSRGWERPFSFGTSNNFTPHQKINICFFFNRGVVFGLPRNCTKAVGKCRCPETTPHAPPSETLTVHVSRRFLWAK